MVKPNIEPIEKPELTPCVEVRFVCRTAPSLGVKIKASGVKYKFNNGVLLLSTAEEVAELRNSIKTSTHMRALVRELDINAAEQIARQHQALMESQRGTSAGGVTGETMHEAMRPTLDDRDNALRAQGIDVDKFAEQAAENDGLTMTAPVAMPDRESELAGAVAFKAAQSAEPVKEADVAKPALILGKLGG